VKAGLLLFLLLAVCACGSGRPLATLKQTSGVVERDWAVAVGAWKPAPPGSSFSLGDGVRTRALATAWLALDDGSQLQVDADSVIRFSDAPAREHSLVFDVETGAASLQAAEALTLRTRVGLARMEPGASLRLTRAESGYRFLVQVGRAVFGNGEPLAKGQSVSVGLDGQVQRLGPEPLLLPVAARADSPPANRELPDPQAAVTVRVTGSGARVREHDVWLPLAEGSSRLAAGAELELSQRTSVELERADQNALLQQNGHYVVAPSPGVLVDASRGALVVGGAAAVRIEVPGGMIEIAPQGRAKLSLGARGTRLEVEAEEALIETPRQTERLTRGQSALLAVGGEVSVWGRGLSYADLSLRAGESLTVHDPTPPTAIRFVFDAACPDTATLSLRGGARAQQQYAIGKGAVSLPVARGRSLYELRCGDRSTPVRHGQLTVLADDGTRRMAPHPPASTLLADGRKYTVLYQNRLPAITLVWPHAPAAGRCVLRHAFGAREDSIELEQPSYGFGAGVLQEGRHSFYFEGDGKLSRHTLLDIQFDNAAPTASLSPAPSVPPAPGASMIISGSALPGWSVWVEGQRPTLDAQGRFSILANMPSEQRALSVKLSHPERGTHVYLRRGQSP
jgi:hypothetical protein